MNVDSQVIQWRPKMMRLTSANPLQDDTEKAVVIDPDSITHAFSVRAEFKNASGDEDGSGTIVRCTCVVLRTGAAIHVLETPGDIATIRDREFGHANQMAAVKG